MATNKPIAAAVVGTGLVMASAGVVALINRLEEGAPKPSYTVYADKLAGGRPTACNGITAAVTTTPVRVGDVWSADKCAAETAKALAAMQGPLLKCFRRTPPQDVFDAATSWAWNAGTPSVCGSQAMAAWNAGDWVTGCRRMLVSDGGKLQWVYAGGQFYPGMANRRVQEISLCLRGEGSR